jgi:class 3 adenylate cyclase
MAVAGNDAAADGPERKLATIVSADVAAYSRLMAEDEEHTLQIFRGHKEVFDKLVQLHRGRVFNTAGDAILAEFGSAVEAVRCASEIQAALRTRNDQLAAERRVMFRIGVNLGDVMVQGEDLLGDGVNVAARLQGAAEPGGICISGSVYDQIVNKLSLSFKPLGEMSYKNIPQLVRTFAIAEAAGLGKMPSPTHRHRAVNGWRLWPSVAAILLLITGGGAFWVYSHHQRSQARHARVAERAAQQQLLVDQRRAENETRLAEAGPEQAEAGTFAAVAVPALVSPQPDLLRRPPTAANPGAAEDTSGLYRGQICYGAGGATEPAHCFEAQAVVLRNQISGEWPGRVRDVTIYLGGQISQSGEVAIHMHSKRADGSRFAVSDLIGTLRDGRIDATGRFRDGRSITLNWRKD